jgi:hypothetical protein
MIFTNPTIRWLRLGVSKFAMLGSTAGESLQEDMVPYMYRFQN